MRNLAGISIERLRQDYAKHYSDFSLRLTQSGESECSSIQRSFCERRRFQCVAKRNSWGSLIIECRKSIIRRILHNA